MKSKLLALALLLLVTSALPAMAQYTQDPDDLGAADTVDLVFTVVPDFTTNKVHLQAELFVFNDANPLVGATMGFTWDNPNLQLDSAVSTPFVNAGFDLGRFFFEDGSLALTNANHRYLFGGATLFSGGLQGQPTRQLWATYYFTVSSWGSCDSIVIDTLTFNAGSDFRFVTTGNEYYRPYYEGPDRTKDTSCAAPSNLTLSPDSLHFEGVQGSTSPLPQTFLVGSDNEALAFTLTETAGWISLSPTLGNTPRTINVLINTNTLAAGDYLDSIMVSSGAAANSPQWVKVSLHLAEPPPVIGATPSQFFFNAVAGGANPDDKILSITNTGGSVLNWTVTNSQPWLTLTPGSGTDAGDVTLSVDITGLAFATYYDTIVVDAPGATNTPKKVPVTLSVGSDLPIIAVDSQYNYVVVQTVSRSVDPRTIHIRNDGAGAMNFYIQENSTRLFTVTPLSGTAPQDVVVGFKVTTGVSGDNYFDTLWVYSDEAINSPVPVIFQFHLQENPAHMFVAADTATLTLYECEMGANVLNPATSFFVTNIGGDNPMPFQITGSSDYFTVQTLNNTAPASVTLLSNYLDLPVGVYWDTLIFYAQKSIVQYDTVFVKYQVVPGVQQPKIWVSNYSFTIPAQEGFGPLPDVAMSIRNTYGGCMEWYVVENIPWIYPQDTSGINPASFQMGVDPAGYTIGEYPDSFFVYAPTASNSPGKVRMRLQVWRFHGDNDWSGEINVTDLVYLVAYLFQAGPEPKPTRIVGDLTCNKQVNVEDLTYFVAYMFQNGPLPCGNPYK